MNGNFIMDNTTELFKLADDIRGIVSVLKDIGMNSTSERLEMIANGVTGCATDIYHLYNDEKMKNNAKQNAEVPDHPTY